MMAQLHRNRRNRRSKGALRERTDDLRLYQELLPTLRLRKRQLRVALDEQEARMRRVDRARAELCRGAEPWAALLRHDDEAVRPFATVQQVVTGQGSIAGVAVPVLEAVRFGDAMPSPLATPPAYDDAIALRRREAELRAEAEILAQQHDRIEHELRRTTQRINLYEELLIPQARADIRRLRVYLGDQQTAAVCRAKLAKARLLARASHDPTGGE